MARSKRTPSRRGVHSMPHGTWQLARVRNRRHSRFARRARPVIDLDAIFGNYLFNPPVNRPYDHWDDLYKDTWYL